MKPGFPRSAVSLVLLRSLVLAAAGSHRPSTSSLSFTERESRIHHEDMRIRTLDQQHTLVRCGLAIGEKMPYEKTDFADRSYRSVVFQKVIRARDRSCDSAYTLLIRQEEQMSCIRRTSKDLYFYLKMFYSVYKYSESRAGTRGTNSEVKMPDEVLQIPRYIRSSASTHRLVIVNILETRDGRGSVHNYLQLSYEDVPSQCKGSVLFKPSQARVVRERGRLYGPDHLPAEELADSDGDTNVARLAAATVLAEWLGYGACAHVGRGGYSASHEGMVHAFLALTHESSQLVKEFMDGRALGIGEALVPGNCKKFVKTEADTPCLWSPFLNFLKFTSRYEPEERRPAMQGHTYRAVISNHRQRLQDVPGSSHGREMLLLPVHNGFMTIGTLDHVYCTGNFGGHTKNMILSCGSETLAPGLEIAESQCHRVMRHRAAFEELMLDVDAVNAEIRRNAEEARRKAAAKLRRGKAEEKIKVRAKNIVKRSIALNQFKNDAAREMAEAEEKVEKRILAEADYIKLCNDLRDEYRGSARLLYH